MNECVSERVSKLENEWVFDVNRTAHAIYRHSFRQSLDCFCFSLFAFRFSLFAFRFSFFAFRFSFFAFRFSIIGLCHVVTVICVHEYVSVWVSEWVLRQSNSSCHMQTFISSKSLKLTSERRKAKSEKQTNFWKTKSEKQTNFWKTKSEKRKTTSKLTSPCL